MKKIVFTSENIQKSKIAEIFFNLYVNKTKAYATSTVSDSNSFDQVLVSAMQEFNVDLSQTEVEKLNLKLLKDASFLVMIDSTASYPFLPRNIKTLNWQLQSPPQLNKESAKVLIKFINSQVKKLLSENDWLPKAN